MPTLSAYTNTGNTSLVVLTEKGYQLWYDSDSELFYAEKNGWDFAAECPTALLGTITIFEHLNPEEYKEYWWRKREPWLLHNLPNKPTAYNSVLPNSPW